jgi:transposase-like protein
MAIVEKIEVFEKALDYDKPCPNCGSTNTAMLGTTNEWKYGCRECGKRWNSRMEIFE